MLGCRFDVIKTENTAGGSIVDWRFSADPTIRDPFVSYVSSQSAAGGAHYWGEWAVHIVWEFITEQYSLMVIQSLSEQ